MELSGDSKLFDLRNDAEFSGHQYEALVDGKWQVV